MVEKKIRVADHKTYRTDMVVLLLFFKPERKSFFPQDDVIPNSLSLSQSESLCFESQSLKRFD